VWTRRPDVLWRVAPGYLVLATPEGEPHEAIGPAAEIWMLIESPRSTGEIVAELRQRYRVAQSTVCVAVEAFLADLELRGLVVRTQPEGSN
jgi:hypothetical protein